jgi:hypothetical protein
MERQLPVRAGNPVGYFHRLSGQRTRPSRIICSFLGAQASINIERRAAAGIRRAVLRANVANNNFRIAYLTGRPFGAQMPTLLNSEQVGIIERLATRSYHPFETGRPLLALSCRFEMPSHRFAIEGKADPKGNAFDRVIRIGVRRPGAAHSVKRAFQTDTPLKRLRGSLWASPERLRARVRSMAPRRRSRRLAWSAWRGRQRAG